MGTGGFMAWLIDLLGLGSSSGLGIVLLGLLGIAAMLLHFRTFRVPFSMFIAGTYGLMVIFGFTAEVSLENIFTDDLETLLDLRQGSSFAIATLIFGLLAFLAGLWFDLRDPHRVGRMARSAFWLHLLAAPALVNTVMMTAYNVQGGLGMLLTIIGLTLVTCFALIIDRRSFLTAGLGYLAAVIFSFLQLGDGDLSIPTLMLVLGAIVTYLGTFWTSLRVRLMHALPDFPSGKSRLPPYSEPRNRIRTGPVHHRPERRQARHRRGPAQPLAAQAAGRRSARRGLPQEHPDDRPHRRRQDRDFSRRLAKLARAPFIKVEATKFTEVGYVGRDVEQIIRDLVGCRDLETRELDARRRQGQGP